MRQRLTKHYGQYGQRWQAETGFSMFKRRLGSVVHARRYWTQCEELYLKAITFNVMLIAGFIGFLQSIPDPFLRGVQGRGGYSGASMGPGVPVDQASLGA